MLAPTVRRPTVIPHRLGDGLAADTADAAGGRADAADATLIFLVYQGLMRVS